MKLTTTKVTTEEQTVVFAVADVALQAIHECLSDGNGYIGAQDGVVKLGRIELGFSVETDQDTGEVSIDFTPPHLANQVAAEVIFTVSR